MDNLPEGNHLSINARTDTGMSSEAFREGILAFETVLGECPQVDFETTHYFANGVYAREMKMNEGEICVGKIHRHAHLNMLSKGKVKVLCEFGAAVYEAPYTFVSEEWTKRIIYALEDSVWTTIHRTDTEDLEAIEREHIAEGYS